jgi:hypothetical protein
MTPRRAARTGSAVTAIANAAVTWSWKKSTAAAATARRGRDQEQTKSDRDEVRLGLQVGCAYAWVATRERVPEQEKADWEAGNCAQAGHDEGQPLLSLRLDRVGNDRCSSRQGDTALEDQACNVIYA